MVLFSRNWVLVLCLCFFVGTAYTLAPPQSRTTTRKTAKKSAGTTAKKKKKAPSPRVRRMHQAFVASASLKPMARQLLQDRTPAAYAGVEVYARRHARQDAGALAWLVVGYAHILDNDYAKAVDPLNHAKAHAGDLGDYVAYYLGSAYAQTGQNQDVIAALADFDKDYPDSLVRRDAHVLYANALLNSAKAQEAADVLEKDRQPTRSDLELTLGRAYAAAGQTAKAVAIFRNLYFTMPLSTEADLADGELKKLPLAQIPPPSVADQKTRADLLLKGGHFNDAANEYRSLLNSVSPGERPAIQLALGVSLRRAGKNSDAKQILDSLSNLTPEQNAERLYNLGWVARSTNDEDGVVKTLDQLRQSTPNSPWMEQALLSVGNMYLLKPDYDRAIDFYRELQQRFPNGSRAAYAHWKVAWLSLRKGRNVEARKEFEQHIALYPNSSEVSAALYWRGRLAEEDNDPAMAQAYYQKISERFRNYYYGNLARLRLEKIKVQDDPPHYALLDRVPPIGTASKVVADDPPTTNLRVQKAELLENGALMDFSIRELQAAADEEKGNWLARETARLYQDLGRYDMALRAMKRAAPNYFAVDLPILPRDYWEALFPRPYWTDIKRYSSQNALDPYLVASLIRQESEFNPTAVSRAKAVGLMQLLPATGKSVAREEKIRHYSSDNLLTPGVNVQLGTRYFRSMVDKFGAFEYALAAYNAGSDRVDTWLGYGQYRDPQEFVESIPFTETREYVQAILRNESVYRQLYGKP